MTLELFNHSELIQLRTSIIMARLLNQSLLAQAPLQWLMYYPGIPPLHAQASILLSLTLLHSQRRLCGRRY